jgi:hypothetical protein
MNTEETILDQWFARAVESYPRETAQFLAEEQDQFRNPVGHALRENLAILLRELLGEMEQALMAPALEAIVRLRAVQALSATEAIGFVFLLRPIVDELLPKTAAALLNRRIDRLTLMACEEYVRCREQIAEIRLNESRRAMAVPAAMARARS